MEYNVPYIPVPAQQKCRLAASMTAGLEAHRISYRWSGIFSSKNDDETSIHHGIVIFREVLTLIAYTIAETCSLAILRTIRTRDPRRKRKLRMTLLSKSSRRDWIVCSRLSRQLRMLISSSLNLNQLLHRHLVGPLW